MAGAPLTIYLMGPTAAGKSALAVELAEALPVEIVSVDSAQVYRGLDIGTAKPEPALRARVPHHLIDLRDPAVTYSVAEFVADAGAAMAAIRARGRVPLLAGGTMLYFRALQSGLAALPARDPLLRGRLDARAAAEGWPALHAELARVDPGAAARIGKNDRQRIQRALEVYELSGTPLSALQAENLRGASAPGPKLVVAPPDRAVLGRRIEARLQAMLAAGFVDEVAALRARGDLAADTPALRAVGYRQFWAHAAGEASLAQAAGGALIATRQLAKRQLTWLRAEPDARWFDPDSAPDRAALLAAVRAALAAAGGP